MPGNDERDIRTLTARCAREHREYRRLYPIMLTRRLSCLRPYAPKHDIMTARRHAEADAIKLAIDLAAQDGREQAQ